MKRAFLTPIFLLLAFLVAGMPGCGDGVSGLGYKNNPSPGHCGDGVRDPGEACDDGNTTGGDGCSADCKSTEVCGNGIVDPGEECDSTDSWCENCVDTRITDADEDGDTIADFHEQREENVDTDSDGTPDYRDTDSDNDGIPDAAEAGGHQRAHAACKHGFPTALPTSGMTTPTEIPSTMPSKGAEDPDSDGIPNFPRSGLDGDGISDSVESGADRDSDGTPNFLISMRRRWNSRCRRRNWGGADSDGSLIF
jgi:cysteine-rich repeat protein